jgi:magnesium chelatase subunit D
VGERAAAVRRRLAFDDAPGQVGGEFEGIDAELAARLAATSPAVVPDGLVGAVAALCDAVGAEGLRADLTICRAAAALGGWEGRLEASPADVRRVAGFALAHRARRDPMSPAGMDEGQLADALDEHLGDDDTQPPGRDEERVVDPPDPAAPVALTTARRPRASAAGRNGVAQGRRGRQIGDRSPDGPLTSVTLGATVRAAASRRAAGVDSAELVEPGDLREAIHEQRTARLVVITVDASGSMGAAERMMAAKGAVMGLLLDAYQRRDLVSLVAFRGEGAEVVLRPTSSVEVARARLGALATGGRTPLAAGIAAGLEVATAPARTGTHRPVLVLITDGRATSGPPGVDPIEAASRAGDVVRKAAVDAVVIDVEGTGGSHLGLAGPLAARMGARHVPIDEVSPAAVQAAVGTG